MRPADRRSDADASTTGVARAKLRQEELYIGRPYRQTGVYGVQHTRIRGIDQERSGPSTLERPTVSHNLEAACPPLARRSPPPGGRRRHAANRGQSSVCGTRAPRLQWRRNKEGGGGGPSAKPMARPRPFGAGPPPREFGCVQLRRDGRRRIEYEFEIKGRWGRSCLTTGFRSDHVHFLTSGIRWEFMVGIRR